jgi:hypothetical protein
MTDMPDDPRAAELEQRLQAWAASRPGDLRPELARRLNAALGGSLSPVHALPSPRVLALVFFGIFVFLAAVPVTILKLARVHLMTDSQSAWMIAIFVCAGFLLCLDLARRMIPGSRLRLPLPAVLALSGLAATAGLALLFPWGEAGAMASEGWRCAALEAIIALPAAGVFCILARRGVLFLSSGLGATLGSIGVFLALAPVQLQCMFPRAPHLLIWHVGPAAILIAAAALAGNWRAER